MRLRCEQSSFTARTERQYSAGNYQCCKMFCVVRNIFRRCEAYLEAGDQHFISSMKEVEIATGRWSMNCWSMYSSCMCTEVPMTPVWLRDVICGIFCVINAGLMWKRVHGLF
jgi:hypothetical protein